ncbi:hypothetical protein [Undibacterium sp. Ren11W]|uniref:hypothetical protein n=1 Tax=Undibacterium sp. Ren11W TaxID=3413045 RepID=UPI003BF29DAD
MTITVKTALSIGIEFDGKLIKDFTVRPAIVRDSIESIEELGAGCSKARLRVAIEARQVTFDGIPPEAHGTDLVLGLCDKDYGALTDAIDEVEKKLSAQSKP